MKMLILLLGFVLSSSAFAGLYTASCDGGPLMAGDTIGQCESVSGVHIANAYDLAKGCALKEATAECFNAGDSQCSYLTESNPMLVPADEAGYLNCRVNVTVQGASAGSGDEDLGDVSGFTIKVKKNFYFDASKTAVFFTQGKIQATEPNGVNYCEFTPGYYGTPSRELKIGETFELSKYVTIPHDARFINSDTGAQLHCVSIEAQPTLKLVTELIKDYFDLSRR